MLLDHVQVAMPPGCEGAVRAFYSVALGLREIPKPAPLAARGGVWYAVGDQELHLGVADDFSPAKKAHPAFRVPDAAAVAERLREAGFAVRWDSALPGCTRFFTDDPFGNRIEILSHGTDRQMEDRDPLTGFPLTRSTRPITEEDVRSLEDHE
jgi:catechol 2,3-dioxygenase-like lactoylglutathione lyase family enzyme